MTMRHRWTIVVAATLTAGAIAAAGAGAQDDTMRLGTSVEAKTTTLAFDGQVDTVLTHGGRGGFGHVGYRGAGVGFYRGGFGGGYRGGFAVGYRGGFYGGYGYGYGGGYGGWYGGYGYYGRPWYPSLYVTVGAPAYYYTPPPMYYAAGYSYYPVNLPSATAPAGSYQLPLQGAPGQILPAPTPVPGMPGQPGNSGNFKYDGGPANPVPLPGDGQGQIYQPTPKLQPQDGRFVSMPPQPITTTTTNRSGFAFPAYGDAPRPTTFASDRTPTLITGSAKR
jgi:hypothetical protein